MSARRAITPSATYEQELLTAARSVARLQAKRRRYRRLLRELDAELRHERKMLKAIASRNDERRPDVAPSRLTNGATGYTRPEPEPAPAGAAVDGAPLIDDAFFAAFQWCDVCASSHHPDNTYCAGLRDKGGRS